MLRCRLCDADVHSPVWGPLPDFFLGTPHRESYARCDGCGLLQAATRADDLSTLYAAYELHRPRGTAFARVRQFFLRRTYDVAPPPHPGAQLLDYGCGDGSFLRAARDAGWQVSGVEMSPELARSLAAELGCEVRAASELPADWVGRFDRISLNMVLEHLDDPRAFALAVARLLRPDGTLYVCVPNAESVEARLFGARWMDLDPPRHRAFFNRAQLERLLGSAGLRVTRTATATISASFAGSLQHVFSQRCDRRVMAALLPLGELWSLFVRDACLKVWATPNAGAAPYPPGGQGARG